MMNCITLGMYRPCLDQVCNSTRCKMLELCDHFIFVFFTVEMIIKMIAMGLIGKLTFLADSWNRLDCFIVLAGWVLYFFFYLFLCFLFAFLLYLCKSGFLLPSTCFIFFLLFSMYFQTFYLSNYPPVYFSSIHQCFHQPIHLHKCCECELIGENVVIFKQMQLSCNKKRKDRKLFRATGSSSWKGKEIFLCIVIGIYTHMHKTHISYMHATNTYICIYCG